MATARLQAKKQQTAARQINVWQNYQIDWTFHTNIYGSFPAAQEVLIPFVQKAIKDRRIKPVDVKLEDTGRLDITREHMTIEELIELKLNEAKETMLPEQRAVVEIDKRTLIFRRIDGKLAVHGGTIRSHIKDCARILSSLVMPKKVEGQRSLNIRATNGLYVVEDWIFLMRDGKPVTAPDGNKEFFVHVTDPRTGALLSSIKNCEEMDKGITMRFTLKNLANVVSEQELDGIFQYGAVHGYGQERSRGYGRYTYTMSHIGENLALPIAQQKPTLEKVVTKK